MEKVTCSADDFLPLLIYVIVKSNPAFLVSNVEYVAHFRSPSCIDTETHYYLTNFVSSVSFIRDITPNALSIDPAEYERLTKLPVAQRQAYLQEQQQKKNEELWASQSKTSARSRSSSGASSILSAGLSVTEDSGMPTAYDGPTNVELFKFRDATAGDLRIQDIPELLSEYKWLVRRVATLEQQLQSSSNASKVAQPPSPTLFFQPPQQVPLSSSSESPNRGISEADLFGTG